MPSCCTLPGLPGTRPGSFDAVQLGSIQDHRSAPALSMVLDDAPSPPLAAQPSAPPLGAALAAGLDRLAHGVSLVQMDGRVWFANNAARALLRRNQLFDDAREPSLNLPPSWATALQRVCLQGRREFLRLDVQRTETITVVATPLDVAQHRIAFCVFGRDELCGSVELQLFALRHQLTNAETLVLRQLCRGLNAAAIATAHGVARTTVLTQIAAIRSKTQSPSVRHLLEALARMPPVCPLLSGAPLS